MKNYQLLFLSMIGSILLSSCNACRTPIQLTPAEKALVESIDQPKLKTLVKKINQIGPREAAKNSTSATVLMLVLWEKDEEKSVELIKLLAHIGVDVQADSGSSYSLLQEALELKKEKVVRMLLNELKIGPKPKQSSFKSPLHTAVIYNSPEVVKSLLQAGTDVNHPATMDDYDLPAGSTALHYIVGCKITEKGIQKVYNGEPINERIIIPTNGPDDRKKIFDLLINHPGINLNAKGNQGRTPLTVVKETLKVYKVRGATDPLAQALEYAKKELKARGATL